MLGRNSKKRAICSFGWLKAGWVRLPERVVLFFRFLRSDYYYLTIENIEQLGRIDRFSEEIIKTLNREAHKIEGHEIPEECFNHGEKWVSFLYRANTARNLQRSVNIIPSKKLDGCHPVLRVFIGTGDSLELRMAATLRHLTVDCPNETNLVIFHFAKDPKIMASIAKKLRENVARKGIRIFAKIRGRPACEL